jgi:hypothetical protein
VQTELLIVIGIELKKGVWDITAKAWVRSQASPCNVTDGNMAPVHSGVLRKFFGDFTPGFFSGGGGLKKFSQGHGRENGDLGARGP